MVKDEHKQHEINVAKADESIFGFHVKAHDAQIHGTTNIQELGGVTTHKENPAAKDAKEKKKHKEATNRAILDHSYAEISKRIQEVTKRADEIKSKGEEILDGIAAVEKAVKKFKKEHPEEYKAKKVNIEAIMDNLRIVGMKCDDTMCKIDDNTQRILDNYATVEREMQKLEQENPEAFAAYKDYRSLAKATITIDSHSGANEAPPIVFKDENGEYYILEDGEPLYVKTMENAETFLADIERQMANGRFVDPDNPIVQEWQDSYARFFSTSSDIGKKLIRLDSERRGLKNGLETYEKELDELALKKLALTDELFKEGITVEREKEIKNEMDLLNKQGEKITKSIQQIIDNKKEESATLAKGFSLKDNSFNKVAPDYKEETPDNQAPRQANATPKTLEDTPPIKQTFNPEAKGVPYTTIPAIEGQIGLVNFILELEEPPQNQIIIKDGDLFLLKDDGTTLSAHMRIDADQRLWLEGDNKPKDIYMKEPGEFERRNSDGTVTPVEIQITEIEGGVTTIINDVTPQTVEQNAQTIVSTAHCMN